MECNEIYSISAFIDPEDNTKPGNATRAGLGNKLWSPSKEKSAAKNIDNGEMVATYTKTHNEHNDSQANGNVVDENQTVTIQKQYGSNPDEPQVDVVSPKSSSPCGIRRDLVGIKLFYFSWIGALGCVLPFVAVFLKQMGLSPVQIGVISGIRPVIGFLSGPIWGTLADKFNIRRILLMVSLTAWLAFYIGLYFIPQAERVTECPETLQPHRDHINVRRRRSADNDPLNETLITSHPTTAQDKNTSALSYNLTEHEIEILKEDLGWTYEPGPLNRVFITSLIVIVAGEFFQAPTGALSDTGTLQTLGPKGLNSYGAQRAWGAIGWAACSLIGGGIVSSTRQHLNLCHIPLTISDYHMLVYVFIAFMAIAYGAAFSIKFKKQKGDSVSESPAKLEEKEHSFKAVVKVFCNIHYGSWILTMFYVGICNGIIWGFLFWHLDNLGGTQLLMGLGGVVACISEFISFHFVGHITKWIGHMGIMYTGLVGYAIRYLVYAFLKNPWWVMPAEILQGATFALIWASLTSYTAMAVPQNSLATVQGIVHGVYFGLGNGLGHLLGGVLIGYYGAAVTFLAMAVVCVLVLVLFFIAQKCGRKPDAFAYQDMDNDNKL